MTLSRQSVFLLMQLMLYFLGVSMSAGGGNTPESVFNERIYLKAAFLFLPYAGFFWCLIKFPKLLGRNCLRVGKSNVLILLYFTIALFSLPFAVNAGYSATRLFYTVFCFGSLFCLIVQYTIFYDVTNTVLLSKHITLLSWIYSGLVILVLLLQFPIPSISQAREVIHAYSIIHPNLLASFLGHLLIFQIGCLLFIPKMHSYILTAILCLLIFLMFSRGVFVSLFITLFSLSFLLPRIKKNVVYFCIPILIILIGALFTLGMVIGHHNLSDVAAYFSRGDDYETMLTLTNRTLLWRDIFSDFTPKIALVGYGYAVITQEFGVDFGTGILYGAHNAYFSLLLGTGIFCLATILLYIILKFKMYIDTSKPPFLRFVILGSLLHFSINCLIAEEIGVNMSVTFSYLVFLLTMTEMMNRKSYQ